MVDFGLNRINDRVAEKPRIIDLLVELDIPLTRNDRPTYDLSTELSEG